MLGTIREVCQSRDAADPRLAVGLNRAAKTSDVLLRTKDNDGVYNIIHHVSSIIICIS